MKPIGKKFDYEKWLARYEKLRPIPEEVARRKKAEMEREKGRFVFALEGVLIRQFGLNYVKEHTREKTISLPEIEKHIQALYRYGSGACYLGNVGIGKTHVLLTIFIHLTWMEWIDYIKGHSYPNPTDFIEKICHFAYASDICKHLESREKLKIAKYNFIDDFGVEDADGNVMVGFDRYFETIYRQGLGIILSSNCFQKDLESRIGYKRIMSRIYEKCKYYILPGMDLRRKVSGKLNLTWRN